MSATQRTIFGKYGFEYLIPDLTEPQIKSFDWLIKEGITDLLSEISPIEDFTGKNLALNFLQHSFGDPKYSHVEERYK